MMRRLLPIALILVSSVALAQTTLDITVPGGQICSYSTGPVSNGSVSGHLQATATSSSGSGCGSGGLGNVTFGPATPVSATAVTTYNGQSTVTFQALNANTSCIGQITPSSSGSFVGSATLCTGAACQTPVTATAQFDNESTTQSQNYTVSVTCTGTAGQATSQAVVSVPAKGPPQDGCYTIANSKGGTFTRMTGTILTNRNDGNSVNRDPTSFSSIFGTPTITHWPGAYGITTNVYLPTSNYMAMAFTVPPGFFTTPPNNTGVHGNYKLNASNSSGAAVAMSISTKCGDFSPPGTGSSTLCVGNNMLSDDFITWTSAAGSACMLESGKSYYLNLINANVETVLPNGGGSATSTAPGHCGATCEDTPTNKTGNWTYVP